MSNGKHPHESVKINPARAREGEPRAHPSAAVGSANQRAAVNHSAQQHGPENHLDGFAAAEDVRASFDELAFAFASPAGSTAFQPARCRSGSA